MRQRGGRTPTLFARARALAGYGVTAGNLALAR